MHGGIQDPLIELQQSQDGREFNDNLVESIDETIIGLISRTVVDALYTHLQTFHSISRYEVPYRLETLFTTLEKTFGGRGSQTITKTIASKSYLRLGFEFTDNPGRSLLAYVDEAKMKLQIS
jgi:hypothetical protein